MAPPAKRPAPRSRRIAAAQLTVDERVQREKFVYTTLDGIMNDFDPSALGTLTVSERTDGSVVVVDGRHRLEGVLKVKGGDYTLKCEVHTGLGLREEALLFVKINNQKPPKRVELHKAMVAAEDEMAVAIHNAVHAHGWKIGIGREGYISAIKSLEEVYVHGEDYREGYGQAAVDNALGVITKAWGNESQWAVHGGIIKAMGFFLVAVDEWVDPGKGREFDYEALSFALAGLPQGARGWLGTARGDAIGHPGGLHAVLFEKLYRLYNRIKDRRGPNLTAVVLAKSQPKRRRKARASSPELPLFSG